MSASTAGTPARRAKRPDLNSRLIKAAAIVVVIAALALAKAVLIPFAVAALLSFILAPVVGALERLRLGRVAPVLVTVALSCALLGAVGWIVGRQVNELATLLPRYEENIVSKLRLLRGTAIEKATEAVQEIGTRLESPEVQPLKVTTADPSTLETLGGALARLLEPLATAVMIVVLTIFMLLQRYDLRDRLLCLVGSADGADTTKVTFDEMSTRVSRYLLAQVCINGIHGTVIGVGLLLLSVPQAFLWGLLWALLRFIPYLGPLTAAAMPIAVSIAVSDGWSEPLLLVGFFIVLELITSNVLEPWLYGSKAGVSTFAIISMAVFWTWLWGPVGLLLSTPLTVCMVAAGRNLPQLRFLEILCADDGGTPGPAQPAGPASRPAARPAR